MASSFRYKVVDKLKGEAEPHPDQPSLLIGSYDRNTLPSYLSKGDVDAMVMM